MILFEENDNRFYISASRIVGAGRGVFATREIMAGEWMPITGVMVEGGSEADRTTCFLDRYKFAAESKIENGTIHLGKYLICPLGYGALVNHTNSRRKQNVEIRYVDEEKFGSKVVYWFMRNVGKDEEILANYGPGWSHIENTKNNRVKLFRPFLKKTIRA